MTARLFTHTGPVVLALAVLAGGLTGCQEKQLKEEIVNLQTQLRLAEAEKVDLERDKIAAENENQRLKGDVATLQKQLDDQAKAPPPTAPKPDFGPGVEVSEDYRGTTVTLPNDILFDSGQTVLKAGSKATLDRIAAVIQRDYGGRIVRVEGHTDTDPIKKSPWKDNWELSCERALSVVRYLTGRGIDSKKIYAAGYGEHMPRDTNATAAGKARNRRVQIVITR